MVAIWRVKGISFKVAPPPPETGGHPASAGITLKSKSFSRGLLVSLGIGRLRLLGLYWSVAVTVASLWWTRKDERRAPSRGLYQ